MATTHNLPSRLVESSLSRQAEAEILKVKASGVKLDEFGQVLAEFTRENELKIARSLLDVRHQVMSAIGRGQHVVYVPGSYDLLHAGHASYIMQATELYLNDKPALQRSDLFVLALSDDDHLIQAVKPPHLTGQPKEHPRPIQCNELFEHCSRKHHPRLWDLAALPVDLVGFIPAPSQLGTLLENQEFIRWFNSVKTEDFYDGVSPDTSNSLESYARLVRALRLENFASIKADFQKVRYGLDVDPQECLWDVGSWQMLMHRFIGDVYQHNSSERYVRIISEHDTKYKDVVARAMQTCGISYKFIDDQMVISTTSQVKQFGWEALVRSKISHFESQQQTGP
jgi:hypothetical protein